MRRRALAIGTGGLGAAVVLLGLAIADVERTTMSLLAALAWVVGSSGFFVAVVLGQRRIVRAHAELRSYVDRLPTRAELATLATRDDLARLDETRNGAAEQAIQDAIRDAIADANDALVCAIDARLVGLAEQRVHD